MLHQSKGKLSTCSANFSSYSWEGPNPLLHFWSICAEEQFYLILPWLLLLSKKKLTISLLCFIPITMLSRFLISDLRPYPAVWNFSVSHLDAFALGILVALHNEFLLARIKSVRLLKFFILISFSLLIFICASFFQLVYTSRFTSFSYFFAAITFGLLLLLANKEKWEFKGRALVIYIGKRSFELYVFHWPILHYTKIIYGVDLLSVESALVVTVLTVALTELSYRYLESPFMKARAKFQGKLSI